MTSSTQVRVVIELFCKILSDNNIHDYGLGVRAETLRQAKFNNPTACPPMWHLLYNVVGYLNGGSLDTGSHFQLTEDKVRFIQSRLQQWGYLDQCVASLSLHTTQSSRALLLALAWLIHKRNLFDRIVSKRCSPLQQDLVAFVGAEDAGMTTPSHALPIKGEKSLRPKDQLQVQVLLAGKLRQSLKRLYASQQLCATLKNKIVKSTKGVHVQTELDHLTSLEVFLVKNKHGLTKMMTKIAADSEQLQDLLDWKEKENIFWEWMDSVLSLHMEERATITLSETDGVDQAFLSVPKAVGQDIADTRAKLRDLILSHEGDMDRVEMLVNSRKVSKPNLQLLAHLLDREVARLSHRLDHCDLGIEPPPHHIHDEPTREDDRLPTNRLMFGRGAVLHAQADITSKVKGKIETLQRRVNHLETELMTLQAQSLQNLQSQITQDPNVICIQPTTLQHFFKR